MVEYLDGGKMSAIYTKKGDEGNTMSFGGIEYRKNDSIIEVNGLIDESLVGIQNARTHFTDPRLLKQWDRVIEALYLLGAEVSNGKTTGLSKYIVPGFVEKLEEYIDEYSTEVSAFTYFNNTESIACEEARVRVRKLERYLTSLLRQKRLRPVVYQYINRLSDFIFVMSVYQKPKEVEDGKM